MGTIGTTGPYLPRGDGPLRDWLNNFVRVAARELDALDLSAADVAMLAAVARRYEAAYDAATSPGTRGEPAVEEKNGVRGEARKAFRAAAMRIKRNMGVEDSVKIELRIRPPHRSQSPIRRPRTAPSLEVKSLRPGVHRLRYRDPDSPTRFAKPADVAQMQLFIAIRRKPAAAPRGTGRTAFVTRHVFNVTFNPEEAGKKATYFGRWVTKRGLAGPWSLPVAVTIV